MILRFRTLFGFLALLSLFSCGGGGSLSRDDSTNGGTIVGGTVTVTRSITLAFTDVNGQPSTSLSESNPLTLSATVTDSNGDPVTSTLITYRFQPEGLADYGNDAGTASTDANGVATIQIIVGANSGAGEIVATLSSGEEATTTFNSAGTTLIGEQPASLDLFGSSTQLASSGSDDIELIALVKDANNVLLEGVDVTFSANAGASLQLENGGSVAVTGVDGIARATLSTQNNQENRTIEVTAITATFSQILDVQVVGTQININGSSSAILNDPVPLTISLVDSDGSGIANQEVSLIAINGQLSETSLFTSSEGQITVNYSGDVSGSDTVTARALNSVFDFPIIVQEDDFSFVDEATDEEAVEVYLYTPTELTVKWLKNGSAFANGTVTLTSSRGRVDVATDITDSEGNVAFFIQSNNAGFASITATGLDAEGNEVNARTLVEFVATIADNIIVDGTPDSVAPSGQTITITSVVRDPNGNLVKGKVINFVVDDVSGGTISPNQSTTNRSGIASTVYTSNAVSSFEAVKVYATVADTPTVSNFTSLTVGDRAFDISIGTGRLIEESEQSSYSKEFSVFVTDPDSNPVPNALMTFSAPPVKFSDEGEFRKGYWSYDEDNDIWLQVITATCPNEDIDGNGILDVGEDANNNGIFDEGEDSNDDGIFDEGEDSNKDGLLTPGNVASIPSKSTTDDNGQTLINILYAKQFGAWVDVDISVDAESAGSESSESQEFSLPVAAADLVDEASPPPNSPYGISSNCNDTD
ncbi:Ig-like domain-containing protein [Paraglaciecola psychrophila]|uniref:Ig-like protein n=1 Tax=Paraglaciecola psychrophila 170 TaxID=1129794 RepID=K7A1E8_9ALTE|nr:Ig-like domain-containing protein [Paraglaciecola psychrophila]AGH44860.1 Ig-like protein [Paraglaciecola psychrophila 170]GAC36222.1 invasin domain protein [Paraglaciecola psychrophila 170]